MERLTHPDCRLLSLVGPGGFGKTRLGIRIGELVLDKRDLAPDGVFFVALDGLESPAQVVPAIAATLNFSFHQKDEPESQLLRYLKQKRLLLILDNAEGILDAGLVLKLLGGAPHLKLLVTTREALNVREEWFHPVAGMHLGDSQSDDAITFFSRCAMRVRPTFELANEYEHVRTICQLVGGVPLAIELAAAWLKGLPCKQVASELKQGIDILTSSMHDVPERHRSLRVVLEQSWRHFSGEEQRVFRQLSIFTGGFQPEAAQVVADTSLPVLLSLVDKSLLQLGRNGRYRIHALLHELGKERLAANPADHATAAARHSAYYLNIIARPARMYLNEGGTQQVEAVNAEINNIFAAWYWAVDHGSIAKQRMAMEGLYWFSWLSTYHEECEKAFRYAIEILRDREDDDDCRTAYAYALACHGTMGIWLGHDQVENRALLESVALLRHRPDARRELAYALGGLGWRTYADSKFEEAKSFLFEAIALDQETEQFEHQAWNYCLLGHIAQKQNDYQEEEQRYQQALRLGREIGDRRTIAHTLFRLGRLAFQRGEYGKARRYLDESLVVAKDGNQLAFVVDVLNQLGTLAEAVGDLEAASDYFEQSMEIAQTWGKNNWIVDSLGKLAQVSTAKGDYDAAADFVQEATDLVAQVGNALSSTVEILWTGKSRLALYTHEYAAAHLHYEKLLALSRQNGNHLLSAEALVGLGLAALGRGDNKEAGRQLLAALQEALRIGFAPILLATIVAVAELLASESDPVYAAKLATVAKDHAASTAETKRQAKKVLTHAVGALSSEAFALATDEMIDSDHLDIATKLATELSKADG